MSAQHRYVHYLTTPIAEARYTPRPLYGMTVDGYTKRSGAPTHLQIRLEGEKRWRRVMIWQFSNAGTLFLRMGGKNRIVNEFDLPEAR